MVERQLPARGQGVVHTSLNAVTVQHAEKLRNANILINAAYPATARPTSTDFAASVPLNRARRHLIRRPDMPGR